MNLATSLTGRTRAGGDRLLRTNPVLCIDQMLDDFHRSDTYRQSCPALLRIILSEFREQRIRVPGSALRRWAAAGSYPDALPAEGSGDEPAHRVLGLGVGDDRGYVVPLRPAPASRWDVDATLPFTAEDVLDGLAGVLHSAGLPVGDAVPERLAFRIENALGLRLVGSSMTVAGVLAVLDHLGGQTAPVFGRAVAVVEADPGGQLRPVSDIPTKLAAAYRECGRLSLVVGPPGIEVDRGLVESVWEVESLADLAGHLHAAGLLTPLIEARGPLTRPEAARILERMRWLVTQEQRHGEAADFGDRVRRAGPASAPDPAVWTELARLHAIACRQNGRFDAGTLIAAESFRRIDRLADQELASDDDAADAAAEYAAALFSSHRFAEIEGLLARWVTAIGNDPRRFRPLTRVKVWNTLGRALVILGRPGWDDLLGRSLALTRQLGDDETVGRTTLYLVHAHLWRRDPAQARRLLAGAPGSSGPGAAGDPWMAYLLAALARLEGRVWDDPVLDERIRAGATPYPGFLYAQATARQPGRKLSDVRLRLASAVNLLRAEAGVVRKNICNLFAAFLELYAAARDGDPSRWRAAAGGVAAFLSDADEGIRQYYSPVFDGAPPTPDLDSAESLLDRVPYF